MMVEILKNAPSDSSRFALYPYWIFVKLFNHSKTGRKITETIKEKKHE